MRWPTSRHADLLRGRDLPSDEDPLAERLPQEPEVQAILEADEARTVSVLFRDAEGRRCGDCRFYAGDCTKQLNGDGGMVQIYSPDAVACRAWKPMHEHARVRSRVR